MTQDGGRDFLALNDHTGDTLAALIARAQEMARCWAERRLPASLAGRRIALVVDDGGWRNTTAFDLGIQAMAGACVHAPIKLGGTEVAADLAAYLDNWVDGIVVRTPQLAALRALADAARAPVINARTRANHPCETLGDLGFVHRVRGGIDGLKVVGVAADDNILRSWVEAAHVLPIAVTQVFPARWHVRDRALLTARFQATTAPDAIADADVVITDSWPRDADEAELHPYRVTGDMLDRLKPGVLFLPCPPVARGREVSADAMLHPACRVVEAKAFLLHAQNALMEWAFAGR
ncbi:MAG: ornithine carbamoyltransferase [Alphaproteobacteria bacterium]|nr:ornithine carbamoyltransferase [Alphaproteobacteria bacterium]